MPDEISSSSLVPVAMAITARVGKSARRLEKDDFMSVLYIAKDDRVDAADYVWARIPHSKGKLRILYACR